MAKIRVYELARVLNTTNKVLLDKINEMNLPVKSHMSSLNDAAVREIKARFFGKNGKAYDEKRIQPTIIRRRAKPVDKPAARAVDDVAPVKGDDQSEIVKPVAAPPADAPGADPSAPTAPEIETVDDGKQVAKPDQPDQPAADERPEAPPVAAKAVKKRRRRARAVAPAKIIRPAVTLEAPEPAADETLSADPDQPDMPPPIADTEAAAPTETGHVAADQETAPAVDQKDTAAAETDAPITAATEAGSEPAAEPEDKPVAAKTTKTKPAAKAKKRARKDAPAKIIRRAPVVPVADPPEAMVAAPVGADQSVAAKDAESKKDSPEKRSKRRGKQPDAAGKDKKFFKKKISFRHKEVVDAADLYSRGSRGKKGRKGGRNARPAAGQKTQITTAKAIKRRVKIDDTIALSELAKRMGIKAGDMIIKLMGLGVMATVNQTIDFDTAALVAAEFDYEVERAAFEEEQVLKVESDDPAQMVAKAPVVTIMGHVDHGKTSLLDVIRKTRVTATEAGGITQHIGAYSVEMERGRICFLDTPGHEAFTSMRSRGAQVTDIVILVVAADDGVMPQTIEAINHARAAEVPLIVAVNKIDKANADPDRVRRELTEQGLTPEDWGGDTIFVHVSAKQNIGINDLLDMVLLQAEMMELKANPDKHALGCVIEARLDPGRGPVATVLVQEGVLNIGDPVVCGIHYGKIRAMLNDQAEAVKSAGPSTPVEIIGLSGVPNAGDELVALEDEKKAKQVSMHRIQKQRSKELAKTSRVSLENLFDQIQDGNVKELNLVLKADVHGSIEALRDSLVKLSNNEVKINIIHAATGAISESDISLAAVSDAIIIGFNVRPNAKVQALATEEQVDIRYYNIIYNVIKDIKDAILGMMESSFEERVLGRAEVREVFHVPKIGAVAGCYITDGKFQRGELVRLVRDGVVVVESKVASLRRFKDDVKEVSSGYECGIGLENFNDIKMGDALEFYYLEEIKPELD